MKFLILIIVLFSSAVLRAEEATKPLSETTSETAAPPAESEQSLLDLCPNDMPPACACIARGNGVRVMPAAEAYKNREKVLLVGPRT